MVDIDEVALWARARQGDGRAFSSLFDRHVDRVFRHVLRLVDTPADADDVAAAAFFELWRRRDAVRVVDRSVLPWLLVTATNMASNSRRGMRRSRALLERMPREHAPDPAETALDSMTERARRAALLSGLRRLSSVDSALIVLTALEGYSVADAAAASGLTADAARTRLVRARRRLRGLLADDPYVNTASEGLDS